MENNTDPKLRRIAVIEVDQASSVVNQSGVGTCDYKQADKLFPQSDTIKHFFTEPSFINHTLTICLYHTADGKEVRRRMVISSAVTMDEIKVAMETAANSVGVHISFHDLDVSTQTFTAGTASKSKKSVKEKEMFLYSLVDFYLGELSGDVSNDLEKIREEVLTTASNENNYALSLVGSFLERYLDESDNHFRLASLFGKHLGEADLKLSTKHIPEENGAILVEFPFGFNFGEFYIKSAFISSARLKDGLTKALSVVCPKYVNGGWDGMLYSTTLDIGESSDIEISLEKALQGNHGFEGSQVDTYKDLIRLCLKCLIYIHSEEVHLTRDKGSTTKQKNIAKIRKFYRKNCPFDITTLGYSFHVLNGGDEFLVKGHFRWQPCGEKLSKVKLIWIDSYSKNKKQEG